MQHIVLIARKSQYYVHASQIVIVDVIHTVRRFRMLYFHQKFTTIVTINDKPLRRTNNIYRKIRELIM